MAFNPFNWFRKHQKKLIVVVTIFVMFIFIVQFGRGDFFERMTIWFGSRRDKGEVVTTINGSKVTQGELSRLSRQRSAASSFILTQAFENHGKTLDKIIKEQAKADPDVSPVAMIPLRKICENVRMREMFFRDMDRGVNPFFFASQIENSLPFQPDFQLLGDLGSDKSEFLKFEGMDKEKADKLRAERLELLGKIATIMGHQYWRYARLMTALEQQLRGVVPVPDDLCFGGSSKTDEDTLDFIMWKNHADRLNIKLTDADLARQINHEATATVFEPEKVDFEKDEKIVDFFRRANVAHVPLKDFVEALKDEFRVVVAQSVLLGGEPGVRAYRSLIAPANPASVTPEEFLEFFRYNRTALKVEMLPISAEKYLAKVTESPSEDEIQRRFTQFKDKEALPGSRDPGFKESRRVVVQFLTADANHPQHRKSARQLLTYFTEAALAQRTFETALLAPSQIGAGPMGPLATLATALAVDPVGLEYDKYANDQGHYLFPIDLGPELDSRGQERLRHEALHAPRAIISMMGSLPRGPLVALGDHYMNASFISGRQWLRQAGGVRMRLNNAVGLEDLFGAAALAVATSPEVRTREEMGPSLHEALEERLAKDLMRAQFDAISKELARLSKEKDKEQATEKYLQQLVKDNPALKLHVMPASKAQMMLAEELEHRTDPKLNDLLDPLRKLMPVQGEREFVATLFSGQNTYEARRAAMPEMPRNMQFRMPHFDPEFETTEALWWLKENHPARSPKSVSEPGVRDKIVLAWKLDRARKMAADDAQKLADELNNAWKPNLGQAQAADEAQKLVLELRPKIAGAGNSFELENVSRLVPAARLTPTARGEYRRYELPPDKKALMPHEPGDLVDQLLTLEKPGRATVISDGPNQTFYVALLLARTPPELKGKDGFLEAYARGAQVDFVRGGQMDPLYNFFVRERVQDYRFAVMKAFREEAGKVNKDGRFEIPDAIKKRDTSADGE